MALTTVVRGRAYDWSHAIGRGAATGTGFNYIQTMCLSNEAISTPPTAATRTTSACG